MRGANGMMDLKKWDCGVPGKEKTIWEGGLFKLEVTFPDEYPTKPPKCTSHDTLFPMLLTHLDDDSLMLPRQIRTPALPPERLP